MGIKVSADLTIEAYVDCPHCDEWFDLFQIQDLLDDGEIFYQVFPEKGHWGKKDWNREISCPVCKQEIVIEEVVW